jgi:hypothetical protein
LTRSFDELARILGTTRFVYAADCKLATDKNLAHISAAPGAVFVTVLPKGRVDAQALDTYLAAHPNLARELPPAWTVPSRASPGAREELRAHEAPFKTKDGHRIVAVHHTAPARAAAASRAGRAAAAVADLEDLNRRAAAPRTKIKTRADFEARAKSALTRHKAGRWVKLGPVVEHARVKRVYKKKGRPRADAEWTEARRPYWEVSWTVDHAQAADDQATDGWYPLITNSPDMTPAEVLAVHKRQPNIEKRFHQLKNANPGADPVRLQKPERVAAMAACWHLAMLTSALIEHIVADAMHRQNIASLPLYPEQRPCARPTAQLILQTLNLNPPIRPCSGRRHGPE